MSSQQKELYEMERKLSNNMLTEEEKSKIRYVGSNKFIFIICIFTKYAPPYLLILLNGKFIKYESVYKRKKETLLL